MKTLEITVPEKILPIFDASQRFIVLYGGRGSTKSWSVAECLIIKGYKSKRLILCTREIQNTIKDSVHKLLSDTIERLGLSAFFEIQRDQIIGRNGTRIIFKGLRHSISEIKSTEGVTDCWVEEGQTVSEDSWEVLIPTIRQEGSQFYITFNPESETDPTYIRFVNSDRQDVLSININYYDNPFFPKVLMDEMEYDRKTNYDKYLWIWEGKCRKISDAQVFKGKYIVEAFESNEESYYYGADWGFAQDPTVLIRSFIKDRDLYIDYEAYGVGIELDDIPEMFDTVPGSRIYSITADSARPETISHIFKKGFNIKAAVKGAGSIEDGIAFIKSFERIIVHPRCTHTIDEFKLYSYKKDRLTGEVLPIIIDKHNHIMDALRYSLEDINASVSIRVI